LSQSIKKPERRTGTAGEIVVIVAHAIGEFFACIVIDVWREAAAVSVKKSLRRMSAFPVERGWSSDLLSNIDSKI